MAARQYLVSEATKREIQRAIKKLDKIHGPHVRNTRDDIYIGSPPQKPGGGGGDSGRMFGILSSTQDGSNFRWDYVMSEVKPTDADWGYEYINSDETVHGRNTLEFDNDSSTSGIQSNIDLSVTGITGIEEIPNETIVCCFVRRVVAGEIRWYFTHQNAPLIDCDEV
jgi:hypothetical protein